MHAYTWHTPGDPERHAERGPVHQRRGPRDVRRPRGVRRRLRLRPTESVRDKSASGNRDSDSRTATLRTNIMDFRGFDSSIIFILRGGIPRPIGDSPESLSQAILVGVMLVGRLGVILKERTL